MKYANYINGEVIKTGDLPKSYNNISGFNNSTDISFLNSTDWFELVNEQPVLKEWQTFGVSTFELIDNKVVKIYNVLDKSLEEYKQNKINQIKYEASDNILEQYPEYKQRNMALGIYTQVEKDAMIIFIQGIRNDVHIKEDAINNATTYEEVEAI